MDSRSLYSPAVLAVLFLIVAPTVWADPTIIANTGFTVGCDTLPRTNMRYAAQVTVPLGATPGSVINCSFNTDLGESIPVYQTFPVQPNDVGVECAPNSCVWTVTSAGFYVLDIASGQQVLGYPWQQ